MSLAIDPDTTVGALLEAYPEVEPALIEMAPAFAKVRNPLVRRTIAKVATLEQVAGIGGIGLKAMILRLREIVGQEGRDLPVIEQAPAASDGAPLLVDARVVEEIDADAMLERGVHPIGRIRDLAGRLAPGEVVVLRSSFRPLPLIETMRRAGVMAHSVADGAGYVTYFGKQRGE